MAQRPRAIQNSMLHPATRNPNSPGRPQGGTEPAAVDEGQQQAVAGGGGAVAAILGSPIQLHQQELSLHLQPGM